MVKVFEDNVGSDASKQPAQPKLTAFNTQTKEGVPKIPSETKLIAPEDYEHIYRDKPEETIKASTTSGKLDENIDGKAPTVESQPIASKKIAPPYWLHVVARFLQKIDQTYDFKK